MVAPAIIRAIGARVIVGVIDLFSRHLPLVFPGD